MAWLEPITLLAERLTFYRASVCVSVATQTWWEYCQPWAWWWILSADRRPERTRETNAVIGLRKKKLNVLSKCYFLLLCKTRYKSWGSISSIFKHFPIYFRNFCIIFQTWKHKGAKTVLESLKGCASKVKLNQIECYFIHRPPCLRWFIAKPSFALASEWRHSRI